MRDVAYLAAEENGVTFYYQDFRPMFRDGQAAHRRLVIRLTCVGAFSALVIALAVVLIRKLHKAGRC